MLFLCSAFQDGGDDSKLEEETGGDPHPTAEQGTGTSEFVLQEDLAEDGTGAEKKEASVVSIKKEEEEEEEGAAKTIEGSQAQV